MSESMRPTRCPIRSRASARLAATVDLPTPPFPDATAIVWRTSLRIVVGAAGPGRGAPDLLGRGLGLGHDLQPHRDVAASDRQVLDEAEGDDVAGEAGEPDRLQDLPDLFLRQLRRG